MERLKTIIEKHSLTLARAASFAGILLIFINIALMVSLNDLIILSGEPGVLTMLGMFNVPGIILGFILCPIFLPVPGREKPLLPGLIFIALALIPNIALRALGIHAYLDSYLLRAIITIFTGILYPACFGLFFLTNSQPAQKRYSGKNSMVLFGIAVAVFIFIRALSSKLLDALGLTADPSRGIEILFNFLGWIIAAAGAASAVTATFFKYSNKTAKQPAAPYAKTDWQFITNLLVLTIVFRILNAIMDLRLFPLLQSEVLSGYYPIYIVQALIIPVIAFFAGPSAKLLVKKFLPLVVALFILLTCLPLFFNYPRFILIANILVGFFNHLAWIFFAAAIVEAYTSGFSRHKFSGFWFYGLAVSIQLTTAVSLFVHYFSGQILRNNTEFTVLFAALSAVTIFFLSFRIIFPKAVPEAKSKDQSFEDIYREYGLTEREMAVADLIYEGLSNIQIAQKIFRQTITVKVHVSNIFRKFAVSSRAEFLSVLMRKKLSVQGKQ